MPRVTNLQINISTYIYVRCIGSRMVNFKISNLIFWIYIHFLFYWIYIVLYTFLFFLSIKISMNFFQLFLLQWIILSKIWWYISSSIKVTHFALLHKQTYRIKSNQLMFIISRTKPRMSKLHIFNLFYHILSHSFSGRSARYKIFYTYLRILI